MSNLEVGVRLTADGKDLVGASREAQREIDRIAKAAEKANADAAVAAERFTSSLKRQADTIGMTGSQIAKYDAAQLKLNATQRASVDASISTIEAQERQNTSLGNLKGTVLAAAGAYISFNAAIAGGRAVIDAALANERLNNTLKVGLGSQQAATKEIAFLREEADRLGLQFATTSQQYAKLTAASKGTALQGQATRDIFLAVAKASTVMGLSADQTGGALLAIEQMISKGTVSAEELRGQLGERLPGAFQIAARAINVTTQELGEMLQKGEVAAEQLLPALAAELERTYGAEAQAAAQGLNAQINRLDNSFTDLKLSVGNTGIIDLFSDGIQIATQFVGKVAEVVKVVSSIPGVKTVTSAAFGGGILPLIFGKDANAATAEIKQTTAALEQAEAVIDRITRPGSKPEPPKEFMAALKREAAERKKIADQSIREAQRAAEAQEREYKQRVDSSQRFINALIRETDEIGKNAIQKRMMAAATEAANAPTKELAAEIMASAQAWAMATKAQDDAIANNRQMADAAAARQRAETQAAQAVQQEWNQTWSTVESTARISFTQFAAHGVGAMEAIGKSIQNGIIDLLYQLTLRKWVINIGATLGLSGGAGSALADGGGGIGSILNIASMGSGALNLLKTGFGATGLAGSAISGLGSLTGSSSLAAFGGGLAGDAIGGLAAGGFTSGAASAASMGASVASFAGPAIAVAAVDQIVRMLAGDKMLGGGVGKVLNFVPVLGPLINGLFGRGPIKQQKTTLSGTLGAQGFIDGSLNTDFRAKGGLFRSDKNDFARIDAVTGEISTDNNKLLDYANQLSTVAKDVIGLINDTTTQVGGSLKQIGADLALSTEGLDNFSHSINLVSEKGKMLTDEQIAEEIGAISDKMARSLLPNLDEFAKRGETALQTVSRLGLEFATLAEGVSVIFGQSGQAAKDTVNRFSIGDRSEFIEAAGGVENLGQKISQFFGNLDDSDKLTILEDRLKTALDAVGVNFIPTMDQFNAAMRSGDLSMQQFIAGLDLQQLIADVNQLNTAARDRHIEAANKVNGERFGLERQLLTLQGNTLELRRQELKQIDPSNRALQMRIWLMQDEKEAVEAEALARARVAQEHYSLESQLLQLQGDTAALRQRELDALDPANRAIQLRIFALQDEAVKADALQRNLTDAVAAFDRQVSSERNSIEGHFRGLMSAVDESIRAATSSVSNLQSVVDSLRGDINNIAGMSISDAQSQIRAEIIGARSGNVIDLGRVRDAISTISGRDDTGFSTREEMLRAQAGDAKLLMNLSDVAMSQLSAAEQSLDVLDAQKSLLEQQLENEISALNRISENTKAQVDAITAVGESLGNMLGNKSPIVQSISAMAQSVVSLARATRLDSEIPKFASGGRHRGGLRIVGERGPELEATGPAMIYSSNQLRQMMQQPPAPLDIERLKEQLAENVSAIRKLQTILERVSRGEDAIYTKPA